MPKQISENKRNMILNGNLSQAILMLAVPVMINSFIQFPRHDDRDRTAGNHRHKRYQRQFPVQMKHLSLIHI